MQQTEETMPFQFIMSSNPDNLAAALVGKKSATVEAEYGDVCVSGSVLTMAHHGSRAGNPAPCAYENMTDVGIEIVGLSHIDLDTLGGCMAIMGIKPNVPGFWELAEFVDLNSPHKLAQANANPENIRRLYAFWAWYDKNQVFPNRDGSVSDVTMEVSLSIEALELILQDDKKFLEEGDAFAKAEAELNKSSFLQSSGGVIVRVSDQFVNHLYSDPEGKLHDAVVAYNTLYGSITVSFADKPMGMNAREFVQMLWGELAGGHDGIAGSPRGKRMTLEDLLDAASYLEIDLKDADEVKIANAA